ATGGFSSTEPPTVNPAPAPNRRLSWPFAAARERAAEGAPTALATSEALAVGVSNRSSATVPASFGALSDAGSKIPSCRDKVRLSEDRNGTPLALKKSIVSL